MQTKKNKNSRKIRKQIATIAAIAYCTAGISGIMPEGSVYNMFEGTSVTVNAADPTVKISATTSDVALEVNKYYYSPDKNYYVVFQGDGNLVVNKKNGTKIWNSGTYGRGGNRCVLQNDGDLVIYSNAGKIWHTATSGKRNPELKLQNDGKLSVYSTAQNTTSWSSKNNSGYPLYPSTSQPVSNNTVNNNTSSGVPYTSTPADILSATTGNTNFEMNKFYYSPDRNYFIVFQNDGNLVIYRDKGRVPVWNSETNGRGGNRCVLQKDGNLVIYSNDGAIWKTGTMGKNSPALRMMNGGTLVMYSTETNTVSWSSANSQGYKLYPAPKTTTEQKSQTTTTTSVYKAQRTIPDGVYCIKNMYSGLYMSVEDNNTANCANVIQDTYNGSLEQRFRVTYRTNSKGEGYYTIHPMNVANDQMSFDLGYKKDCDDGSDLKTYAHMSAVYTEQRYTITAAAGGGYQIGSFASKGQKVLEVTNSSLNPGEQVQIWQYSTERSNDNWEFEEAKTGMAYHIVTSSINSNDINDGANITLAFRTLGYDAQIKQKAQMDEMRKSIEDASVLVIHGHGCPGGIKTDVDGGWIVPTAINGKNSTDKALSEIISPDTAKHLQLVYLASCNTGSVDPEYNLSMAEAAYKLGAKCVIGFNNTVAGAEDYLLAIMNCIEEHDNITLQNAMDIVDRTYSYKGADSPVNCKYILGNTNIVLDLRMPEKVYN